MEDVDSMLDLGDVDLEDTGDINTKFTRSLPDKESPSFAKALFAINQKSDEIATVYMKRAFAKYLN
ncbi:hypothetical protein [Bacillus sp. 2205SS5-2]|uniref:hypothetical protein n=1 Tax=Bacillus sp. 2205SS5-2 TaxID=3109031 RepID=UPI003003CB6C